MALKRLNNEVQSLLSASTQINSYRQVVEELVYNALDAESTSIAIRVHIEEHAIQVIDNGNGIKTNDYKLLGQRYATSKTIDVDTLKSVPNKYGYKGQALSSLIEVSRDVTITSRCENDESTMKKIFYKGKEIELTETTQRPSKGTTVEIKGFLYNMHIQKKSINAVSELQSIKNFVEHLSLVQSNISLSLRDDSTNEIIFKLHKNRDVYQTLSSVFGIHRNDLQELKVEKNQYKVAAFIGKRDTDLGQYHWVYLNGKFTNNKEIYKIINECFAKAFSLNATDAKVKHKKTFDKTDVVKGSIPVYFIFVTCPYYDYCISETPKQSVLEFRTWNPIIKLIEKLVKFYMGDVSLKEIKDKHEIGKKEGEIKETRNKVQKIMEKILGNMKRPGVTQMQRGVKGKLVKRTAKTKTVKISLSKVLPIKVQTIAKEVPSDDLPDDRINLADRLEKSTARDSSKRVIKPNKQKQDTCVKSSKSRHKEKDEFQTHAENKVKTKLEHKNVECSKINNRKRHEHRNSDEKYMNNKIKHHTSGKNHEKNRQFVDPLIQRFEMETKSVKQRCSILAKTVDDLMGYRKNPKHVISVSKNYTFSKVTSKNSEETSHKQEGRCVDDHLFFPRTVNDYNIQLQVEKNIHYTSNYDLVHTVMKTQVKTIEFSAVPAKKYTETIKNRRDSEYYDDNILPIDHTTPSASVTSDPLIDKSIVSSGYVLDDDVMDVHDNLASNIDYSPSCQSQQNLHYTVDKLMSDNGLFMLGPNFDYRLKPNIVDRTFIDDNSFKRDSDFNYSSHQLSDFFSRTKPDPKDCSPIQPTKLTYDSHNYNFDELSVHYEPNLRHDNSSIERKQKKRFITKQSRDNFVTRNTNTFKRSFKNKIKQIMNAKTNSYVHKPFINFNKMYNQFRNTEETSSRIEFTKSYENNIGRDHSTTFNINEIHDTTTTLNNLLINELSSPEPLQDYSSPYSNPQLPGTYVIPQPNSPLIEINGAMSPSIIPNIPEQKRPLNNSFRTYIIQKTPLTLASEEVLLESNDRNVIISESKSSDDTCLDPLSICETELRDQRPADKRRDNSLFREEFSVESMLCDRNNYSFSQKRNKLPVVTNAENLSHHFVDAIGVVNEAQEIPLPLEQNGNIHFHNEKLPIVEILEQINLNSEETNLNLTKSGDLRENFNFKNRPRFVPKGLSPIFENCQSKTVYDYNNMEKDYFKQEIYDNFAQDVQMNAVIFEANIQGMKELHTKDIDRVNARLKKDHASLKFDSKSLKSVTVLGQIDNKFIAAKIKTKTCDLECLVLFDQHAVHERIRLENNLADYLKKYVWKSVPLDPISIEVSKDEIVYLHNYKEKFSLFGLSWEILDQCKVIMKAIPEAVLGKNARSVDVVMKAIKRLITEETNAIKAQKGCVSLYPKSIMDLVCNEACKYAVKFGDRLTKSECVEYLNLLSDCKTPFQCAHGRPLMAVIMNLNTSYSKYKVDTSKIVSFLQK